MGKMRRHSPLVVLLNFGKREAILHNLHAYLKMLVLYLVSLLWLQGRTIGIPQIWTYHPASKVITKFLILQKILLSKEDPLESPLTKIIMFLFIISSLLVTLPKLLPKTNNNSAKIQTSPHSINLQINKFTYSNNKNNNHNFIIHTHKVTSWDPQLC